MLVILAFLQQFPPRIVCGVSFSGNPYFEE
jgi:hypothetical protein